jgi:hypothetical protein
MAKLTAPLFSLKASGQLGKTLVYMNWKGLEDVRQYVIPANPKTAAQQAQRGYITDAVNAWHTDGYTDADVTAWNLEALAEKIAASGFNMFCRFFVLAKVAAHTWTKLTNVLVSSITSSGASVAVSVASDKTGKLYLGTSKTSMLTQFSGTFSTDHYTFTLSGLSANTKYYFYIKNTTSGEDARTGIYSFTTSA